MNELHGRFARKAFSCLGVAVLTVIGVCGSLGAALAVGIGTSSAGPGPACTTNFVGADSTSPTLWNLADNWSTGSVPGAGDFACISSSFAVVSIEGLTVVGGVSSTFETEVEFADSASGLELADASDVSTIPSLAVDDGDTFTVDSGVSVSAGALPIDGSIVNNGLLTVTGSGDFGSGSLSGTGTTTIGAGGDVNIAQGLIVSAGSTIVNKGTMTWSNGSIILDGGSSLVNAGIFAIPLTGSGGSYSWTMGCGGGFADWGDCGTFDNESAGTIDDTSTEAYIQVPFQNAGAVDTTGDLSLFDVFGPGTPAEVDSGSYVTGAGALTEFIGLTRTFTSGVTFMGAGSIEQYGGSADFNGNTVNGFIFYSGFANGDLTIGGNSSDEQGYFGYEAGDAFDTTTNVTVAPSATLAVDASNGGMAIGAEATVDNEGTIVWEAGNMQVENGSLFENSGTFEFTSVNPWLMEDIEPSSATGLFVNEPGGTIDDTGSGDLEIQLAFENDGSIDAGTGATVYLGPGGASADTGEIEAASGATVYLYGSSRAFAAPAAESGAGLVTVYYASLSGILNIEGNFNGSSANITGASTVFSVEPGATFTGNGFDLLGGATLDNEGTLSWSSGYNALGGGATLANSGIIDIDMSGSYLMQAADAGSGTIINTSTGAIYDTSSGSPDISVPLDNAGLLSVTGAPLYATALQLEPTSTLAFTLNSPTAGGQIDSGALALAGTLLVTNGPAFTPASGTHYTVVMCSPCSGAFASILGSVTPAVSSSAVTVTAGSPGPAIKKVSLSSLYVGRSAKFVLQGKGFSPSDTVQVDGSGTSPGTTVVTGTPTSLSVEVDAVAATPGLYLLVVTSPAGATTAVPFHVVADPSISSTEPTSLTGGEQETVVLYGSGFVPASEVAISGATVDSVDVVWSGEVVVTATLPSITRARAATISVRVPAAPAAKTKLEVAP